MPFGKIGTNREERINHECMRTYRLARTGEQWDKQQAGSKGE